MRKHVLGLLLGSALPLFSQGPCNLTLEPAYGKNNTVSFSGEFLYWRYSETSSDFIRTGTGLTNAAPQVETPVAGYGTRYAANFGFDPGWRAALSCSFGERNAFDVTGRYTSFHPVGKNEFLRDRDLVVSANSSSWFFDQGTAADQILVSTIKMDLHFNLADLAAGYKIALARHYFLHPFAGITGYFAKGELNNSVQFINGTAGPRLGDFTVNEYQGRTSAWGLGALVGFDGGWSFSKWLSLVASFDFRSLFTNLSLRAKEPSHDFATGEQMDVINFKYSLIRSAFLWDFKLGPRFDFWFAQDRCHLSMTASWEVLDSLANIMAFLNTASSDVGFGFEAQGLTLSGLFEF